MTPIVWACLVERFSVNGFAGIHSGSLLGDVHFCAEYGVVSAVKMMDTQGINEAYSLSLADPLLSGASCLAH
ncbi:hypothetical protein YA0871_14325 [Pseudomonas paralactis]|uniref:Uncharacterized protein n=1 Tax=Pseudomonas paralactis TaxID=1615673 RepID=A0ABS0V0N4_9PSED|nr:hypothetical protein [Pseudomonas paralactis]MBI6633840.1 hypothetical protein [Pseudomonas paralactis]